ncbi:MAG: antibiotic biosynthesis monooxygenase [Acidimicrobiia bacterium]
MSTRVIRYRTKPEQADENQKLVEDVFTELADVRPAGLRYASLRLSDGTSFVHVVTFADEAAQRALGGIGAFGRFQAGIADRCDEQPVALEATVVGSYGFDTGG